MKKNLPLQYAATIREEHAAWVVRLAEARTKRHLRDGDADEAEEYKKKPVQLVHLAPPPPEPTSMERFLKLVDEQDTRGRKIMLLTVMRMCDQFYREKGRAGWGGNIRALRKRIAEVEHELATVSHIH